MSKGKSEINSRDDEYPQGKMRNWFGRIPAGSLKTLVFISALLASLSLIATKYIDIRKSLPDLYYPLAAQTCPDKNGYSAALRAANIPLIRCYIESQSRSGSELLPASDKFSNSTPLVLVAETCNAMSLEYLIDKGSADPRLVHRYDYDENECYFDNPKGRCSDSPRDIVESKCSIMRGNLRVLTGDGERSYAVLKEAELKFDPTGREPGDPIERNKNESCPWTIKKQECKNK